mgnify:FL=1
MTAGTNSSFKPTASRLGIIHALAIMIKDSRPGKYIIYIVALAALTVFAPYIPTSSLSFPDPIDNADTRVRATITDNDLRDVIRVIRRGRVNSIYEIVRYKTRRPLLSIAEVPESDIGPNARLEVMVGEICGPLCGSGERYYLDKTNGRWHVVETSEWVS